VTVRRGLFDADGDERPHDGQHGHAGVQRRGTPRSCRSWLRADLARPRPDRCIGSLISPVGVLPPDVGCRRAGRTVLALLFVGFPGWHPTPRLGGLLVAWGIVLVPIAIAELSFLRDPTSYAAVVMVAPSKQVLERTIALWLDNFTPWCWPFARPEWYVRPSAVIPTAWIAAGSPVAASLFLLRVRTKTDPRKSGKSYIFPP
jgi:hypothetical protein